MHSFANPGQGIGPGVQVPEYLAQLRYNEEAEDDLAEEDAKIIDFDQDRSRPFNLEFPLSEGDIELQRVWIAEKQVPLSF